MSTDKSNNLDSTGNIAQSAGLIGVGTLASRILGFGRDIVIARLFGIYIYAQAFVVAFRIPNLFRDLLGEGAANAAFVPVFSEYNIRHSKEEFWHLYNILLNILLIILSFLVLAGIIFAPFIVRLIAPGFMASADKLQVTIRLTRIIFPYILLISLSAYAMALLNSLKHFSVPAFAPCLLNISIIVCALVFGEGIKGLASGVLIGGILQLLVQVPVVYKKGFRFSFSLDFKHPAVRLIGKLMIPRILSSSIYQLNNFVDTFFGSLAWIVGEGGVAVLYFAYRLIQFPIGVFSNSLSQATLPTLSVQALGEDHRQFKDTFSFSLRALFVVMLPASFGFIALAKPIIITLFSGGRFDDYSVVTTARVLAFYSIGLVAYGGTKVIQSCFFALKDTKTPAKVAFIALATNVILNSIFMFPFKISGIALATSLSAILSFIVLFIYLHRRIGDLGAKQMSFYFLKILIVSMLMGTICYALSLRIGIIPGHNLINFIKLVLIIICGIIFYVLCCMLLKIEEAKKVCFWLFRRK
ncbi:MAG: murein biosynthesis integral membrane protein MurJ [Candidatus Omnitrophica bacterium]|nr:murein biosynthesis integral membrane protein MurJ [Candidatus Omnitrophota bacterium]